MLGRMTMWNVLLMAALSVGGLLAARFAIAANDRTQRVLFFVIAAALLSVYSLLTGASMLNGGQHFGLMLAWIFLAAQVAAWVILKEPPSLPIVIGGLLIATGGFVLFLAGH